MAATMSMIRRMVRMTVKMHHNIRYQRNGPRVRQRKSDNSPRIGWSEKSKTYMRVKKQRYLKRRGRVCLA